MDAMVKLDDIFVSMQDEFGHYRWPIKLAFQQAMAHGLSVNKAGTMSRIFLQAFCRCLAGITLDVDCLNMPAPSTCKEWNLENTPLAWASAATRLARQASPTGLLHLQLDHGSCKQIGACVIFLWYLDRVTQKRKYLNLGPNELVSGKTAEVRARLQAAMWSLHAELSDCKHAWHQLANCRAACSMQHAACVLLAPTRLHAAASTASPQHA